MRFRCTVAHNDSVSFDRQNERKIVTEAIQYTMIYGGALGRSVPKIARFIGGGCLTGERREKL